MLKFNRLWLLIPFLVSACSTIEKRSEQAEKLQLSAISNRFEPQVVWATNRLALDKSLNRNDFTVTRDLVMLKAKNQIYVLNACDGAIKSRYKHSDLITAGPIEANAQLFFADSQGKVTALDKDGTIKWQQEVFSEVLARPLPLNNSIIIAALNGSVLSLDQNSGKINWLTSNIAPTLMLRQASSPIYYQDSILLGLNSGKVLALAPQDGQVIWEKDFFIEGGNSELARMRDISSELMVNNNTIYAINYHGKLQAINALNGEEKWQENMDSTAGFTFHHNNLVISASNGHILTVSMSGKKIRSQTALQGRILTAPVSYGDYLVVGDREGNLHWLNSNLEFVARINFDNAGIDSIRVWNKAILVLGRSGKLALLNS